MPYIPGDYWVHCQRTGFKVRASTTKREWTGLIVRNESWEPRHPQDFVMGRADNQTVADPRPEPAGRSVGPKTTFISATDGFDIGSTALTVDDEDGFSAGNTVYIPTEGGTLRTTVSTATGGVITLARPLPGFAAYGTPVTNASNITTATDGF